MSEGSNKGRRIRKTSQLSISTKVSVEQKRRVRKFCTERGCTESELVLAAVFGRMPDPEPLHESVRAHLSAVHALRAVINSTSVVAISSMDELISATRELIIAVREAI